MILIDTNILAYLLIDGERTAVARELHRRDSDWRSEAFLMVEFSNVLLRYMTSRALPLPAALGFLRHAEQVLRGKLANVPHEAVLENAARFGITAYDARFLTVAETTGLKLTTEDAKLRAAAPDLTQSLSEALRSAAGKQT